MFNFVPNNELFETCERILKKSDGRTNAIQAVCMEYAKKEVDQRYKGRKRPLGTALRVLTECEIFENRADMKRLKDGSVSAPAVCGSLVMEESEATGAPLPEYIPSERLQPACVGAFEGEKMSERECLRSFGESISSQFGLPPSLAGTYCDQLRVAVKATEEDKRVEDTKAFCAKNSTLELAPAAAAARREATEKTPTTPPDEAAKPGENVTKPDDDTVWVRKEGITVPARKRNKKPPPFVHEVGDSSFGKGKDTGARQFPLEAETAEEISAEPSEVAGQALVGGSANDRAETAQPADPTPS